MELVDRKNILPEWCKPVGLESVQNTVPDIVEKRKNLIEQLNRMKI